MVPINCIYFILTYDLFEVYRTILLTKAVKARIRQSFLIILTLLWQSITGLALYLTAVRLPVTYLMSAICVAIFFKICFYTMVFNRNGRCLSHFMILSEAILYLIFFSSKVMLSFCIPAYTANIAFLSDLPSGRYWVVFWFFLLIPQMYSIKKFYTGWLLRWHKRQFYANILYRINTVLYPTLNIAGAYLILNFKENEGAILLFLAVYFYALAALANEVESRRELDQDLARMYEKQSYLKQNYQDLMEQKEIFFRLFQELETDMSVIRSTVRESQTDIMKEYMDSLERQYQQIQNDWMQLPSMSRVLETYEAERCEEQGIIFEAEMDKVDEVIFSDFDFYCIITGMIQYLFLKKSNWLENMEETIFFKVKQNGDSILIHAGYSGIIADNDLRRAKQLFSSIQVLVNRHNGQIKQSEDLSKIEIMIHWPIKMESEI